MADPNSKWVSGGLRHPCVCASLVTVHVPSNDSERAAGTEPPLHAKRVGACVTSTGMHAPSPGSKHIPLLATSILAIDSSELY